MMKGTKATELSKYVDGYLKSVLIPFIIMSVELHDPK